MLLRLQRPLLLVAPAAVVAPPLAPKPARLARRPFWNRPRNWDVARPKVELVLITPKPAPGPAETACPVCDCVQRHPRATPAAGQGLVQLLVLPGRGSAPETTRFGGGGSSRNRSSGPVGQAGPFMRQDDGQRVVSPDGAAQEQQQQRSSKPAGIGCDAASGQPFPPPLPLHAGADRPLLRAPSLSRPSAHPAFACSPTDARHCTNGPGQPSPCPFGTRFIGRTAAIHREAEAAQSLQLPVAAALFTFRILASSFAFFAAVPFCFFAFSTLEKLSVAGPALRRNNLCRRDPASGRVSFLALQMETPNLPTPAIFLATCPARRNLPDTHLLADRDRQLPVDAPLAARPTQSAPSLETVGSTSTTGNHCLSFHPIRKTSPSRCETCHWGNRTGTGTPAAAVEPPLRRHPSQARCTVSDRWFCLHATRQNTPRGPADGRSLDRLMPFAWS